MEICVWLDFVASIFNINHICCYLSNFDRKYRKPLQEPESPWRIVILLERVFNVVFGRCRIIKTWAEWEPSIHTDEAQISRQGRAMNYPFSFRIAKD